MTLRKSVVKVLYIVYILDKYCAIILRLLKKITAKIFNWKCVLKLKIKVYDRVILNNFKRIFYKFFTRILKIKFITFKAN